jgi:hypothetical protein
MGGACKPISVETPVIPVKGRAGVLGDNIHHFYLICIKKALTTWVK